MTHRLMLAVFIALAVAVAVPAFAQRDKMSLGESFGAVILKPAPVPQPAPSVTVPQESLQPKETLVPVLLSPRLQGK